MMEELCLKEGITGFERRKEKRNRSFLVILEIQVSQDLNIPQPCIGIPVTMFDEICGFCKHRLLLKAFLNHHCVYIYNRNPAQ